MTRTENDCVGYPDGLPCLGNRNVVHHYCDKCGAELPHGRQQYCLNCLLKDYIKAKEEGKKAHNHLVTAYARLRSRGLDKELIELEIEEREI